MAASFLASFLIFILTGVYSIYFGLGFTENVAVKVFVSLVLLVNSIFYHYVAAYTEIDEEMKGTLRKSIPLEWAVRVINQCILLSLWFWLDHGWILFGRALISLYLSFLFWDTLTWKCRKSHNLFWVDLAGTALSVAYIKAGNVVISNISMQGDAENAFYLFFGAFLILYLGLPVVGVVLLKFNPFKKEYWTRPMLH